MSKASLLTLCVLAVACTERQTPATAPDFSIPLVFDEAAGPKPDDNLVAHAAGENEVPPRETRARGNAIFHVSDDGLSVDYKLIVANIENVRQSHIHLGDASVAGPIVVFLYGPVPAGGGRIDGVIAEGTFTAANLIGPLAGHPLSDLLTAMRNNGAYANVHTDDGVPPANTGPGDFPGGEVRGTIMGGHSH
jgi:hypothetical protein